MKQLLKMTIGSLALIALSACSVPNHNYRGTAIGSAVGALAGGVIGHQLHHDNGRYVGGVTGALIGGAIGNNYDQNSVYAYPGAYYPGGYYPGTYRPPAAPAYGSYASPPPQYYRSY